MANKRMFSKSVISTDIFLDLPDMAKILYFYLSMDADDDGFVSSPRTIMRVVGAKEEDLDILIKNNYVIKFASGIILITHWLVNNTIKGDRYKETVYLKEKALVITRDKIFYLGEEKVEEIPCYESINADGFQNGSKMVPKWFQDGSKMETQSSIDKSSIDKNNIEESKTEAKDEETTTETLLNNSGDTNELIGEGAFGNVYLNAEGMERCKQVAIDRGFSENDFKTILNKLSGYIATREGDKHERKDDSPILLKWICNERKEKANNKIEETKKHIESDIVYQSFEEQLLNRIISEPRKKVEE